MRLSRWFEMSPITKLAFAEKVGVHRSQVYRWISGETRPDYEVARRIQDLTDGAVRLDDWVDR